MSKSRNVADIIKQPFTTTLGTSNYRAGVNAGNSIASGGNYNVTVGDEAGTAISTGDGNTAVGYNALVSEDEGNQNTAIGHNALANLNSGTNYNVAVGSGAGTQVTTGAANTFLGGIAGQFVSTASSSTFVGYSAGLGITGAKLTGGDNTAVGRDAGLLLQGGANGNSLFGRNSGDAITTGSRITAIGYGALSAETTGTRATAVGYFALAVQNKAAESHNTAVGYNSSGAVSSGDHNTSMGYGSLDDCDDGNFNTAIGSSTLSANCGSSNTAVGDHAGNAFTGSGSTFLGATAGQFTTSADYCTFVGHQAGLGISGTPLTGNDNTAVGHNAGLKLQGAAVNNTLIGKGAGDDIADADGNTCLGYAAGGGISTGQYNTSLGLVSMTGAVYTGQYNISLGYNAHPAAAGTSGQCTLGDGSISDLRCNDQSISALSDERDKTNIVDSPYGLDFINATKPRQFLWDARDVNVKNGSTRLGFIAQELLVAADGNNDVLNLVMEDNPEKLEAKYGNLLPIMVKAIQELSAKNDALEARITALEGA